MLGTGFVLALALSVWLPTLSPAHSLGFLAVLLAAPLAWGATRHPLGGLVLVGVFFGIISRNKTGIQVEELLFAATYLGYLSHWFITRIFVYRASILRGPVDLALAALLVYMTASVGLTGLFGGSYVIAQSEWINYSMFAFYFPVREACERYKVGPWVVAGILFYLGLYAAIRNLAMLQTAFASADHARAIAGGRLAMNEMPLLVAAIGSFAVASTTRKWPIVAISVPFAALLVGALIMSQSRAYYVDLAVGVTMLFVLLRSGPRVRLALVGCATAVVALGTALTLFGDAALLVGYGVLNRLLSLGTAAQVDVSLLNRFIESRAAWDLIKVNPIVGYGIGVEFTFFDAIFKGNWQKGFVHNGFLMLWYKFGIFGLLAVLAVWVRGIWSGIQISRSKATGWPYVMGIWGCAALIALIPSHASAATFSTSDTVFVYTLVIGFVSGLHARLLPLASSPDPAPEAVDPGLVDGPHE